MQRFYALLDNAPVWRRHLLLPFPLEVPPDLCLHFTRQFGCLSTTIAQSYT